MDVKKIEIEIPGSQAEPKTSKGEVSNNGLCHYSSDTNKHLPGISRVTLRTSLTLRGFEVGGAFALLLFGVG